MFDAVSNGDRPDEEMLAEVQRLMADGAIDPNLIKTNMEDGTWRSPLYIACRENKLHVVRLIAEDARVNPNDYCNKAGLRPISIAAWQGHHEVVAYLGRMDSVDINAPDHRGWTALYISAKYGLRSVVAELVKLEGIGVELPALDGITPVCMSAQFGFAAVVRQLLNAGAALIPAVRADTGATVATPLHRASKAGTFMPILLYRDPKNATLDLESTWDGTDDEGFDKIPDVAPRTPIQIAAAYFTTKAERCVRALILAGADFGGAAGADALVKKIRGAAQTGYTSAIAVRTEQEWRTVNPNAWQVLRSALRGDVAALDAAMKKVGDDELADVLLTRHPKSKYTPLIAAAGRGHHLAVLSLLKRTSEMLVGADTQLRARTKSDRAASLLAAAQYGGHPEFARPGVEGVAAALCIAATLKDLDANGFDSAELLVMKPEYPQPDESEKSFDGGNTTCAIHLMVSSSAFAAVLADVVGQHNELADARDKYGRTAYALAVPACSDAIAKVLYFMGRYNLQKGPPEHKSPTSLIVRAEDMKPDSAFKELFDIADRDHSKLLEYSEFEALLVEWKIPDDRKATIRDQMKSEIMTGQFDFDAFCELCKEEQRIGDTMPVVLKFFNSKGNFDREKQARENINFDTASVVEVLRYFDSDDANFIGALKHHCPGDADLTWYPHAFVMESADRNLEQIHLSEQLDDATVANMMRQVAAALASLHKENLLHGDVKLKNIVRVAGSQAMKLRHDEEAAPKIIDFDAAVKFGEFAGAKLSTGCAPPEIIAKAYPHSVLHNVKAHYSFDSWSFGVVLYTLLAGDTLFRTDRNDNIATRGLKELAIWSEVQCQIVLSQSPIKNALAIKLLKKLLHPDPTKRPSMAQVLEHDYFGKDNVAKMLAMVKEKLDVLIETTEQILVNTVELKKMSKSTQQQLESTQAVLLQSVFEATEVKIPTSIIILDHRLKDDNGEKMAAEDRVLEVVEDAEPSWFTKVTGFLKHPATSMKQAYDRSDFVKQFQAKEHFLYFVDEVTGMPVGKPIVLETTSDMGKKLLPYMKFGLKAMKIANGVASIARVFVPVGVPKVPKSAMENVEKAVATMDKDSSVADFKMINSLVMGDADADGTKSKNDMRGASLREFEEFLAEKDPHKNFAGLSRVVWGKGDAAGTACWTLPENVGNMDLICNMQKKNRMRAEQEQEQGSPAVQRQQVRGQENQAPGGAPPAVEAEVAGGSGPGSTTTLSASAPVHSDVLAEMRKMMAAQAAEMQHSTAASASEMKTMLNAQTMQLIQERPAQQRQGKRLPLHQDYDRADGDDTLRGFDIDDGQPHQPVATPSTRLVQPPSTNRWVLQTAPPSAMPSNARLLDVLEKIHKIQVTQTGIEMNAATEQTGVCKCTIM